MGRPFYCACSERSRSDTSNGLERIPMMPRFWEWMKKESNALIVLLTGAIVLFTGLSLYINWKDFTANQNVREYITGIRKGEYKIDLGNGEYIGAKFLVDDSKIPYEIDWYWRKNTEPSQITRDNAEKVSSIAIPMNTQNKELLQELFED